MWPSVLLSVTSLYDAVLPLVESFVYLGFTFTSQGIDWKDHFGRLGGKAMAVTAMLAEAGLKGRTIGPVDALRVFKTFIRPILEYGLAICPQKNMANVVKLYNRAIRWISSIGKYACADVFGLFGACEPLAARQEKLGVKYHVRLEALDELQGIFVVKYARRSHLEKEVPKSLFTHLANAPQIRGRRVHWIAIGSKENLPTWSE